MCAGVLVGLLGRLCIILVIKTLRWVLVPYWIMSIQEVLLDNVFVIVKMSNGKLFWKCFRSWNVDPWHISKISENYNWINACHYNWYILVAWREAQFIWDCTKLKMSFSLFVRVSSNFFSYFCYVIMSLRLNVLKARKNSIWMYMGFTSLSNVII